MRQESNEKRQDTIQRYRPPPTFVLHGIRFTKRSKLYGYSHRIRSKETNFLLKTENPDRENEEFLPGMNQKCFHEIVNSAYVYYIYNNKEEVELSLIGKGTRAAFFGVGESGT